MTQGQEWPDEIKRKVLEAAKEGLTGPQIAERTGLGRSQVENMLTRYGWRELRNRARLTRVVSETPERVVLATESTANPESREVWEAAEKRTARDLQRAKDENCAVARIVTDKPICVSLSSDWHLAPRGAVDLGNFRVYAEAIRDTPGAFAACVGDLHQNPIRHDVSIPDVADELRLVDYALGIFGTKMLAVVGGNHDYRSYQQAGLDQLRWLTDRERVYYAPDEINLFVEIVSPADNETVTAKYLLALRHQFRRHSNLNPLHACWRYLEERVGEWPATDDGGEYIPDVVAIGHNHKAAAGSEPRPNKRIWAARFGAWQWQTGFSRAKGYQHSPPTAPSFVFWPNREREPWGSEYYEEALEYLEFARERMRRAA